jgi:acyl-CoA synthetase (AMP-forming)/AMP-acid ligase II
MLWRAGCRGRLQTGDRVAIHCCNSAEVVNLYFAYFKTGLIAVPVNNRLKASEIGYIWRRVASIWSAYIWIL